MLMTLPFGNISILYQKPIEGVRESGENGHDTDASKFPSRLWSPHHSKKDDWGWGDEGEKKKNWQAQA